MLKILTAQQMRETDEHTIKSSPISSLDLMERASAAFVKKFVTLYPDRSQPILVCCGTGNNGGDGLAIARLLHEQQYGHIRIWIARFSDRESDDFRRNLKRMAYTFIPTVLLAHADELPRITETIVIDALLGSGLNKELEGDWSKLADHINAAEKKVVAVDIATGLPADGVMAAHLSVVKATETISFQRPKLSFFFPESAQAMQRFYVVDIGLDEAFIDCFQGDFYWLGEKDAKAMLKVRMPFSHKGVYGHALIVAGSTKTMGAALICAEACLHTGAGLTTACIPSSGLTALNVRLPEVMFLERHDLAESDMPYNAIAVGPGLGINVESENLLSHLLLADGRLVLDADALNLLAKDGNWQGKLPKGTVLTPHVKEFDRLFGPSADWYERVQKAKGAAKRLEIVVILKNQYTFIALPDGRVAINGTGNPGMASGGMGDALTGIIVSLLAQGYSATEAALIGVYLHGRVGDEWFDEGHALISATKLAMKIPELLHKLLSTRQIMVL